MVKPPIPPNPPNTTVSTGSPDDDPTGVRALLSALPEPDPMPEHLVERINASLAAEQTQRATKTSTTSTTEATPLLARRRPGRILFAMAGAAAAVALVAVVGSNLFTMNGPAQISGSASIARDSRADSPSTDAMSHQEAGPETPPSPGGKISQGKASEDRALAPAAGAKAPSLVQIRVSDTQYTRAGFASQARTLGGAALDPPAPTTAYSTGLGPVGTTPGLTECLTAIGAQGAQVVRADVALYEGQPAVIIVATTNGLPMAYAVGRQCSAAAAEVLHAGTPLP